VVVKRALPQDDENYDPTSSRGPAVRLFNEWASLQFLNERFGEDSPVPHFYGGDQGKGVVVMGDLGAGVGLNTVLLGEQEAEAQAALTQLFQVLGRMHAVSIGHSLRYQELRAELGPLPPSFMAPMNEFAQRFVALLEYLQLPIHPLLESELEACVQMVSEPGAFNAFIHCDPCPDNCLVIEQGLRLLDFEFGQFGLALWDGTYARSRFPTCWCVNQIPSELVELVEAAYRIELSRGCPQAEDDGLFGTAVVVGCTCALLQTLRWTMPQLLEKDEQWGIATERQRVLVRLDALHQATRRWDCFPVLGETAHQLEEALRRVWLPAMQKMPLYPAFRSP
jgi:hypothetical protein